MNKNETPSPIPDQSRIDWQVKQTVRQANAFCAFYASPPQPGYVPLSTAKPNQEINCTK